MTYPGLPALPLENPACRPRHGECNALGVDYLIEPVVGNGLRASNGAEIDTSAFTETAPGFCCPKSKTLAPAEGIKQF